MADNKKDPVTVVFVTFISLVMAFAIILSCLVVAAKIVLALYREGII